MSTETIHQRPIFGSEDPNLLTPDRPPVSGLAICSVVMGLISSIALLNLDLVALPILTAAFGLAAYLLIATNEGVRGQTLALGGMGLGIVFAMACYISTQQRDQYLYVEGGKVAEQFLQVVGQNKLLEAYELTRSEPERQVAGTSLEEAYKNKNHLEKENVDAFKRQEAITKVVSLGTSAQWKLESGVRVLEVHDRNKHITIKMVEEKSQDTVELTLNRDFHLGVGSWFVVSVK